MDALHVTLETDITPVSVGTQLARQTFAEMGCEFMTFSMPRRSVHFVTLVL